MRNKQLNVKGEVDYDYKNDILFFKAKEREYKRSIEMNNIILDVDKEGFITGLQIIEASKYLNISKDNLLKIPKWNLNTVVDNKILEIRLLFQINYRNKTIEKNPIITQHIEEELPNSELFCVC